MTDPLQSYSSIVSPAASKAVDVGARNVLARQWTKQDRPAIRARFDSAQTVDENRRHWANADSLSARAANSPQVRLLLRNRSRYESANNSYARGIVLTLANDTIGTGPRLQLNTPDQDANRRIEQAFMEWADDIALTAKLHTMRQSRAVDGEAFALLETNPRLDNEVQLDIRLIEADQVATPFANVLDPNHVDGIELDSLGNVIQYHVLKYHPGDVATLLLPFAYDRVPSNLVLHWFRVDRPGQKRGLPDIMPALPLFAQLRRYTLAVLAAAETAADFAAVLFSELPPDSDGADDQPFESFEIERRMMTTLPAGWKMGQFKAEQPTTTYAEFKHEILNEIARCLNMPFNIAAGNSSGYNYASGRLDHQTYYKSLRVDQAQVECVILDRLFEAWLDEYSRVTGDMPGGADRLEGWPHQWFWDGQEHVDPLKEAKGQETRLLNNTTTLACEFARQGKDWEVEIRQRAKEIALMTELGIPIPSAAPATTAADPLLQDEGSADAAPNQAGY